MSDITGTLHHDFRGKTFALRLTLGGIAKLQGKHGLDLGGLLSGTNTGTPPFGIMIDMVSVALVKGGDVAEETADDLADDMLTEDKALIERLMQAAFPEQDAKGNGKAPKAKG